MPRNDRMWSPARSTLRTAALVAALAWTGTPVQAQETGRIRVNLGSGGERGSFMISCIHEGEVVFQTEGDWGSGPSCRIGGSTDIPVGVYDVRVEGGCGGGLCPAVVGRLQERLGCAVVRIYRDGETSGRHT